MLLRHATPRRNLASIQAKGLCTRYAKGARPLVWAHSAARSAWAVLHTVRRHGGRAEDVVVLEVDVPRRWLKRHGKPGLWYTPRDIPPARIRGVLDFGVLSAPVAE